jgi:hypothetical protein
LGLAADAGHGHGHGVRPARLRPAIRLGVRLAVTVLQF